MKQHVEQLRMLWQLQELEQRILVQEHKLQNIAIVNEHRQKKQEFQASEKMLQKEEEQLITAKKELRRKEIELQSATDLIEKLEHKLYSGEIHNAKELEGLEKKVRAHKKEKIKLEDDILQLMENIEQGELDFSAAMKIQAGKKEALQQLGVRAQRDIQMVQGKLNSLKEQQQGFRQSIDAALLDKYTELSRYMRGRCVSLVQKGFCGICNVSLPSSFRARMLTPGEWVFCENCGCLLVPGD